MFDAGPNGHSQSSIHFDSNFHSQGQAELRAVRIISHDLSPATIASIGVSSLIPRVSYVLVCLTGSVKLFSTSPAHINIVLLVNGMVPRTKVLLLKLVFRKLLLASEVLAAVPVWA